MVLKKFTLPLTLGALTLPSAGICAALRSGNRSLAGDTTGPTITFRLNSQGPELDKKEEFMGGIYASLTDAELYPILVQEAMDRWNQIDGSYVRLEFAAMIPPPWMRKIGFTVSSKVIWKHRRRLANPIVEEGIINDCDIKISNRKVSTKSLAYTLMHELGHCLVWATITPATML